MSFICQQCHQSFGTNMAPVRTVTKTRRRSEARGGGLEIAEEKDFCQECAKAYEPNDPIAPPPSVGRIIYADEEPVT